MAVVTTLRMMFDGENGKNITMSFPYADPNAAASAVKTLAQVMVANGEIYAEKPLAIIGAEFVSREVTEINLT